LLVPLDFRGGVRRPRALLCADPGRRAVRRRRARRLRGDDRGRRRLEDCRCPARRARRRRRMRGRGALRAHGCPCRGPRWPAGGVRGGGVGGAEGRLDVAGSWGARDAVLGRGGAAATAEAVRDATGGGVDYAIEATGRPEAMEAAFLSTRARGAAVLIGIPR